MHLTHSGVASGYPNGQLDGNQVPEGYVRGQPGSRLPTQVNATATWHHGTVTDVAWTITANHGGGYHYSVCPKGATNAAVTEACLHAHPLQFVGSNHTIRYTDGRPELQIPAKDVAEGTFPKGSTWRANPIPACNCDQGFGCSANTSEPMHVPYWNGSMPVPAGYNCPTGTMFPPPFDYGYGHQMWTIDTEGPARPTWMIVDQVRAPAEAGEYVLRWRWVSCSCSCSSNWCIECCCLVLLSVPTLTPACRVASGAGHRAKQPDLDALCGHRCGVTRHRPETLLLANMGLRPA